jgi:hypothetical protein
VKKVRILVLLLLLLPAGLHTASADQPRGALWAASDGQGTVSLFWIPKDLVWPTGGWRLESIVQGKSRVLADKISPGGDRAAMGRLRPADQTAIDAFRSELQSGAIPKEDREIAVTVMGLSAASNADFGLAVGLRYQDSDARGGERTYRLIALNDKGKKQAVLQSAPVDPLIATPLPETPPAFMAVPVEAGVELSWDNPAPNPQVPVYAFAVEREDAAGGNILLTDQPLLMTEDGSGQPPARFLDQAPPKESEATYRLFSLDLFGRRSRPGSTTLFIPDLSALTPPAEFAATAGENEVALAWEANPSPYTRGYVIERALLRGGPFTAATPEGLEADRTRWEDTQVVGGTSYFYRIRSMDPRGDLGPPSLVRAATPQNRQAPPRPDNLKADVGRTRVRLTWDTVRFPAAGYLVERRAADADRWVLLTPTVVPEPVFDDHIGLHTQGAFRYRITAVAFDDQQSKPSREVEAVLLDTVSPNPPQITSVDGRDGKVVLTFEATPPQEDVASFLVVRSVTEDDPGLVIGDPIPAGKGRFEDRFVTVGEKYWYRLVAVDTSGNRSDPSWARRVRVQNPPVPGPPKPSLEVEQEPLRHVRITFKAPPEGLEVIVQRRGADGVWRALTGGIHNATDAVDLNPPQEPRVYYRLVYRAANGAIGDPSTEEEAHLE